MIRDRKMQALLIGGLVLLNVMARLLPHPPQFTPLAATTLLAGALLANRHWALLVPLCSMFVSDALIGHYEWRVMLAVYASLCLPLMLGGWLRSRQTVFGIGGIAILSSLTFFALTNFAVWAGTPWYPATGTGLTTCYVNALPFLRNMMFGDLCWSFGLFAVAQAVSVRFENTAAHLVTETTSA